MQTVAGALSALDDGKHRAEFYRMWRAGYAAAFPHPKSLETMGACASAQTESARQWLLQGTTQGKGIADLVRTGGARFEEFERALLTLGEESGSLDGALQLLGDFYAKKHKLMLNVKKQLAYPMMTAVAACFIAPFKLAFDGQVGAYFALALAGLTVLFMIGGGVLAATAARYGRSPAMGRARMARALVTAVASGLTLPRAIRLAADASANSEIQSFVARQDEKLLGSRSLVDSLHGCPHLSLEFFHYLQTAEKTGDFTPLSRLAEMYEDGFR